MSNSWKMDKKLIKIWKKLKKKFGKQKNVIRRINFSRYVKKARQMACGMIRGIIGFKRFTFKSIFIIKCQLRAI